MDGWNHEWIDGQMERLNGWMDIIQRHAGLINRGIVFLNNLSEHYSSMLDLHNWPQ